MDEYFVTLTPSERECLMEAHYGHFNADTSAYQKLLTAGRKGAPDGTERWMEVLSDDVHFKSARIFDTYDDFVAYHSDNPLTRHIPVEAVRIIVADPATYKNDPDLAQAPSESGTEIQESE